MVLHHGLLNGMKDAAGREVIDRHQFAAMQVAHEHDAGIRRFVGDTALAQPADGDGACAAVAFRSSFLRALVTLFETQVVKHRARRIGHRVFNDDAATQEPDLSVGHGLLNCPPVGRITMGRKQKRHMIMLAHIGNAKLDRDHIEERRRRQPLANALEVFPGPEAQFVKSHLERVTLQQGLSRAPVRIGHGGLEFTGSPETFHSSMMRPAAGRPRWVSSTCVVKRPVVTAHSFPGCVRRGLAPGFSCRKASMTSMFETASLFGTACSLFWHRYQFRQYTPLAWLRKAAAALWLVRPGRWTEHHPSSGGNGRSAKGMNRSVPSSRSCSIPIVVWKAMHTPSARDWP